MRWEDLVTSDPEFIICMPCGYGLTQTRAEMHWLTDRPDWNTLRAVRAGQVYLADGNQYLNRPGPRVVESMQILGEILYPDAFEPNLESVGWERFAMENS